MNEKHWDRRLGKTIAVGVLAGIAAACTTTGTGLVWKKASGESPTREDRVACGAIVQQDGSTLIPPNLNATYDACMRSTGFVQVQGNVTSTLMIGRPPPVRTDDPAVRAAMGRNATGVRMNQACADLFIPVIQVEKFDNIYSMWHLHFINNSSRRYNVSFDVKYERVREAGTFNEELTATIRPGAYTKFPLDKLPGKDTRVVGVDVFRCTYTEHTDTPLPAGVSPSQQRRGAGDPATQSSSPALPTRPAAASTAPADPSATMTIAEAQRRLTAAGFAAGPADGRLGASTTAAIRAFQAARKLPVTGLLDKGTIAELAR